MMQWDSCFSDRRIGSSRSSQNPRTEYQRDFDRLIFASAFRRLQNKTQVFPLPGSTFVHNRLTHSLEVSSVGRSLGSIIGNHIANNELQGSKIDAQHFYQFDLPSVIAAACLAHDIGNPAFGHSGEKAISSYFISNAESTIGGVRLIDFFSNEEWTDLITFEGNANALRVLTHSYRNKPASGMGLTFSTLAAILKYPCESTATDKSFKHRKKYGFFQAEKSTFLSITSELNMLREESNSIIFKRHPYVYLTEAADDICYRIVDLEDAHRLGIISKSRTSEALLSILDEVSEEKDNISKTFLSISDDNDSIAYLRAKTINALTSLSADIFIENKNEILKGSYNNTLIDQIEDQTSALKDVMTLSISEIYNHHTVVEIELTGFHVMSHLLSLFVPAVLRSHKVAKDRMALNLIPLQFREYEVEELPYKKVLSVVDFISGMTDTYATEFYRKTTGIDISKHR